jgi:hypothetical protein
MSFDDYIFATPGFLRGAARVLDFGGNLGKDSFLVSESPAEADRRAIASDWRVTGRDLNQALEAVDGEVTSKCDDGEK